MANTTNFGWETPDDTDLVKDGASAMRTLGNAIDTSLVDLKGGTTGQVLSKASNTDLDFTWVAQDDSNAIQNALLTTTGDTIYASSASTPARLGIGSTGQVLTVSAGVPVWATPSSGSMTQLATGTLSTTNLSITSISQLYRDLRLIVRSPYNSNSDRPIITFNANTGGVYDFWSLDNASSMPNVGSATNFFQPCNVGRTTANDNLIIIDIYDYAGADYKTFRSLAMGDNGGGTYRSRFFMGGFRSSTAITSVQIGTDSATAWAGGTYTLFGVN